MVSTSLEHGETEIQKLGSGIQIAYHRDDNVIVSTVIVNDEVFVGVARCMPTDKFSVDVGKGIAIGRAIASWGNEVERTWFQRSTTKEEWKARHAK